MTLGPEYDEVERPLIDQLKDQGWTHLEGAPPGAPRPTDPGKSGRTSFAEVILEERLRAQLRSINKDNHGQPWLDERRISQAVAALTRVSATSLLEANRAATDLLLNGTTVDGVVGWDGGRDQRIHYIDWANWDKPHANDCVVISQFRVDIPGTQGRKCIVPDEVLFVNGIPLAVVECKKPGSPLKSAVDQHLRYADRRGATVQEGNEKLFHTVQLLVATTGDKAALGSITSQAEHYAQWRDPYPLTVGELAERLRLTGPEAVTQQDILAGVVLHPSRLLDIVRNYVTFMHTDDGTAIKAVPRYQQYRAVNKAIHSLLNGDTKSRSADATDHRGGVVWHTQGSGKSLTMSFLVRKMRTVPGLRKTKIVIVTDRTQLQDQLSETLQLTGEPVTPAKKIAHARQLLAQHGPGIVCVMIQKQQEPTAPGKPGKTTPKAARKPVFPELNDDESIVVLIDEAHRSHSSTLHMNLIDALPNAARIGFTGTPILMGDKKKTTDIFGPYIDVYKLSDAEEDGAVVPIFYAGRTVKGAVRDGQDLDDVFEDMMAEHTPAEMEEIKKRYATKGDVMEAEELIAAKARNMLRHYVQTVLPNGFKAQVAAHSRVAAVRYRDALIDARDELVRKNRLKLPPDVLDQVRQLDFIPVISPGENDPKVWETWTDPGHQDKAIADFKDPAKQPSFLIVKSMLLTGFDAPVEQVLYLDRSMKEAELLQAIARVNRPATGTAVGGPDSGTGKTPKQCGYVIDYVGVTQHLTKALAAYDQEDIEGAIKSLETDQVHSLRAQRARLHALFNELGITLNADDPDTDTMENCVLLLADGPLRDRFETELSRFLKTIDTVLPMPAAREFLPDAKLFAEVAARTRRRYRETGDFDPSLYGEKVRELIDEHMTSLGISEILPPVSITSPEYAERAARLSPRSRASEMEHAIRHHINLHLDEDPARYRRLSERLEQILEEHRDNWEQQALALAGLLDKIKDDDVRTDHGDSHSASRLETALYGLLVQETSTDGVITEDQETRLGDLARALHELALARTTKRDFWRHPADQADFVREIAATLITENLCASDPAAALADKLIQIIRANARRN